MESNFKIKSSKELGDYLVSKVDIEAGQVVLAERPLFISPKDSLSCDCCPVCLKIVQTDHLCQNCRWPFCSPDCAQDEVHRAECKILSKNRVEYTKDRNCYLKLIRIMSARGSPDFETLMRLSSDIGRCKGSVSADVGNEAEDAFNFLKNVCGMEVTMEDILKLLSVIKVNYFKFELEDICGNCYGGYVLVPLTCKISHSCAPNLEWAVERKFGSKGNRRWEMRLHARSRIQKGDALSMRYSLIGAHVDTTRRRPLFSTIFPFDCLCSRCKDPTEEGTFFGSPICGACATGTMLAVDPVNSDNCLWKCDTCSQYLRGKDIFKDVSRLDDEVTFLIERTPTPISMAFIDRFIERNAGQTLHENHFVLFKAYIAWLFQGDFTRLLFRNDEESKKLYEKIMHRADRALYITAKFLPTLNLVDLELLMAQMTVEFGFKFSRFETTLSATYKPEKLPYSEKVLFHLTNALTWAKLNPRNRDTIRCAQKLRYYQSFWVRNTKYLSGESFHEDGIRGSLLYDRNDNTRLPMWVSTLITTTTTLFVIMWVFYLLTFDDNSGM